MESVHECLDQHDAHTAVTKLAFLIERINDRLTVDPVVVIFAIFTALKDCSRHLVQKSEVDFYAQITV